MKICLLSILIGGALVVSASAQSFTAPALTKKQEKKKATAPPVQREEVTGVIPRAVRGGNPLQMLNPKAPPQYGTAEQSVTYEPYTGKWKGIKLFTFNF